MDQLPQHCLRFSLFRSFQIRKQEGYRSSLISKIFLSPAVALISIWHSNFPKQRKKASNGFVFCFESIKNKQSKTKWERICEDVFCRLFVSRVLQDPLRNPLTSLRAQKETRFGLAKVTSCRLKLKCRH